MGVAISQNFVTIGTSSGALSAGLYFGLYTRKGPSSTSVLSLLTSASMQFSATGNNSSYTINYPYTTDTAGFTNQNTNSAGANITSQFTGDKFVAFPVNSLLTPGNYWLGVMFTEQTATTSFGFAHSVAGMNPVTHLLNMAPIGMLSSAFTAGSTNMAGWGGPLFYGQGWWSTLNNAALPNSIGFQSITATSGVQLLPFARIWSQ